MNSKIYEICGESDLLPELENIKNDPNYVFQPDPTFTSINLFNELGNIITVNSWIECANYVNGGWLNRVIETTNYERNLFFGLISIILIIFIPEIIKFFNRFSFSKREKTF